MPASSPLTYSLAEGFGPGGSAQRPASQRPATVPVLASNARRCNAAARLLLGCVFLLLVLDAPALGLDTDDLAARRFQIEQMTPAEQQDLLRRQERFATLPPEEQQRLRSLQASLDADPHARHLELVLKHYHEWLKTLSPGQRAELAELRPADRVAQIKRIKQQQEAARQQARRAELLSPTDVTAIVRWTEDLLWAHRERFLAQMPSARREAFERLEPSRHRHALLYFAYENARKPGSSAMSLVEQENIDQLAEKLSPAAKGALAEGAGLPAERRIVAGWIGVAMHRMETQQAVRKLAPWVDDELMRFFKNELKRPDRERLLRMSREQMVAELRKMYFEREQTEGGMSPSAGTQGRFRDLPPGDRFKGPRNAGGPPTSTDNPPKAEIESKP
jgi:hypothetical protein